MNDFKTLLGIAFDVKQAQSELDRQIKSLQKSSKLALDLELSDKDAKKVIQDSSKMWQNYRKEAVSATTSTNTELKKMKQYYIDVEKEIQRNIQSQKKMYLEEQQAYKQNTALKQKSDNTTSGKIVLDNKITAYLNNNAKLTDDLRAKLIKLQHELKSTDNVNLKGLKNSFAEIRTEAQAAGVEGDTFFSKLGKNIPQFLGFMGSATIVMTAINAVRGMVSNVKELDSAMTNLRKVTDETTNTYKQFLNEAANISQELGSSMSSVVEMVSIWAKLGYTIQESSNLAKVSTIYANVGDIKDTGTAVSDLVTAMKAYNIEAKDAMSIADKLNEIGNNYATDAASLGTGLKNAASSLNLAGNSIDESLAMLTAMTEVTQDASESGNSLKVLAMRIRGMRGELEKLGESSDGIESISKIQTQILNLTGNKVNIFDDLDPTKFRSTYDIMLDIYNVWDKLSQVQQAELLEVIAGKQRGNSVAALIQSMGQAEKVLETSLTSQNSALKEQEKYMQSIQYSADRLKGSLQELSSNTMDSNWIKGFYDLATALISTVDNIGLFNIAAITLITTLGIKSGVLKSIVFEIGNIMIAQTGWTVSTYKQALAQVGLTGAIKATATALKSFLLTNPVGWAILAAGAVFGLVKAYDHFNVTLEEQKEILETANTSYEESKTKLEAINKELETVSKRISELNSKDNLTFIEKGELEELKDVTKELLIQQDILEKERNHNAKNLANKAVDTYDKQFNSYSISQDKVTEYKRNADIDGNNVILMSDENDISSMIAAYKQFTELKEKAFNDRNNKDVQHYSELLDDISLSLNGNIQDLTDLQSKLNSVPFNELTDGQKQTLSEINNAIELIYTNIDPNKWKDIQFKSVYDTSEMKSVKEELESLAKAGELTPETISSNQEYKKLLDDTGLSAEEVVNQIKAMVSETENLPKDALTSVFDISSQEKTIDAFQSTIDKVSSSLEKLSSGNLTDSEITDLLQEFPELIPYIDDLETGLKALANNSIQDLISAFETMRTSENTEYIDTIIDMFSKMGDEAVSSSAKILSISDAMSSLKANKQLLETVAEDMKEFKFISSDTLSSIIKQYPLLEGVVADYISGLSSAEDVLESLSGAYKTDFENYRQAVIKKKETDGSFYKDILKNISDSIKNLATKYIDDFNNYKDLQTAKLALDKEYQKKKSILEKATEEASKPKLLLSDPLGTKQNMFGNMENSFASGLSKEISEIEKVFDAIDTGINATLNLKDFSITDSDKSKDKDKNKFSKVFDWIEIRISKSQEKAQKAIDSIANYINYKSKNAQIEIAVKAKTNEAEDLKKIQDSYNKAANKVGLSKTYKDLVDNGSLKIETITDEKLANKIDEYKQWRDKAKEVGEEIDVINGEIKELNGQSLDNIKSYFDVKNSTTDARISNRESSISLKETNGKSATKGDYKYLINRQATLKTNAQTEYDAYNSEFQSQIAKGDITIGDSQWKAATAYLIELQTEITNCDIAIAGFNKSISDIPVTDIQNKIKTIDASMQKLEDSIALKEAKGNSASKSDYDKLIKLSKDKIATIKKENNEYKNQQKGLSSTDAGYIELQDKIDGNLSLINACKIEQVNWNSEIRNLNWKSFDKAIDKLNTIKNNLSSLSGMISGDLVDEDGNFTDAGITQVGLYAQQITNAKNEVNSYANAITKLKKELSSGVISQQQYDEELANYISLQNQAAVSIKEYEQSILELNKRAVEAETDAMRELIKVRKDDLAAQKASDDYAKKVKASQDSIDILKKKISALSLSTDRKDIAQRLALEKDLKDKQLELEEIHSDEAYNKKVQGLDDELESYEKTQDKKLKALDNNLDAQQKAIKDSLSLVQNNYDTVLSTINTLASTYGLELEASITSPWESALKAANLYKDTISSISGIGFDTQSSKIQSVLSNANGTGAGTSDLNKHITGSLGYNQLSYKNMAELAGILGVSGVTEKNITKDTAKKMEILEALKRAGFANGGYIESGYNKSLNGVIKSNGDDVLMTGKVGEAVFKKDEVVLMKSIISQYIPISKMIMDNITVPTNIKPSSPSVNIHYDTLLNVEGNIDKSMDVQGMITTALDKNNSTILRAFQQRGIK